LRKTIDILFEELSQISRTPLFQRLDILDMTPSVIKARLMIRPDLYVQIYVNLKRPKCSYALLFGTSRIYGRDMIENDWHKHPVENPEMHDCSEDPSRSISISDFVEEVEEILIQRNLI